MIDVTIMESNKLNQIVNNKTDKIEISVLKRIKPTKSVRTELVKIILDLFERSEQIIKAQNYDYKIEPILVGSMAKDTYLANPDIDLFLMFPVSVPVDVLRAEGLIMGKAILPTGEERYAEHPYIAGKFQGFDTDIVPCYKLASIDERMTAVDRTPFHTKFIVQNLEPSQRDEVRLLKQFMKGIGIYGAEIQVQGFSGYLCELLILKYGTFRDLLKVVATWPEEIILIPNEPSGITKKINREITKRSELPTELAFKFKDEPIVFIDPVDPSRNVASAVSIEKFKVFKIAALEYIRDPKVEYFFPNQVTPLSFEILKEKLDEYQNTILGIQFKTPDAIQDVLFGQVRKCRRTIQKILDSAGFGVVYSKYFVNDKTIILFELRNPELSDVEIHTGPPEGHANVSDFLDKWQNSTQAINEPYLKNRRWYVDIKREFIKPDKLILTKAPELNLGKQINDEIKRNFDVYQNTELLLPGFELLLTVFIERKYPWEY
jgi:tRNA nucleotidyltransferase (CCA-adding enzyme)